MRRLWRELRTGPRHRPILRLLRATATTTTATEPPPPPSTAPVGPELAPPAEDAAADDGIMTPLPPPPARVTCGAIPWPPSNGGSYGTIPVPPGHVAAFAPPASACADVADGCSVSFSMGWGDGYTESGSQVLTAPGTYTLSGDRGTSWTFVVSGDLVCSSSGGNYSNMWPAT